MTLLLFKNHRYFYVYTFYVKYEYVDSGHTAIFIGDGGKRNPEG